MEQKTLAVQDRKETGKGAARRLRVLGRIPAVVYGKNEVASISVDAAEFSREFKHVSENVLIQLGSGKDMKMVIIKDYQEDLVKNTIDHIDFYEIEKGKTLTTNIPLSFTGMASGVREGGILEEYLNELEVDCLPKDMPSFIEVDVSELNLGDSIHVGQIVAPKGVIINGSEDQIVVAVHAPSSAEQETDEETDEMVGESASESANEADGKSSE